MVRVWLQSLMVLLFTALLFSKPLYAGGISFPTKGTYNDFKKIGNEIRRIYSPDSSFYVFLGQSPAPVMAEFEAAGIQNICAIPFSKVKYYTDEELRQTTPKLMANFDRFLPSKEVIRNRKIIVIDFAQSGLGLEAGRDLLNKYLKSRGRKPVEAEVALVARSDRAMVQDTLGGLATLINLPPHLFDLFDDNVFKGTSPYGKFDPRFQEVPEKILSPGYIEMLRIYRQYAIEPSLQTSPYICQRIVRFFRRAISGYQTPERVTN